MRRRSGLVGDTGFGQWNGWKECEWVRWSGVRKEKGADEGRLWENESATGRNDVDGRRDELE